MIVFPYAPESTCRAGSLESVPDNSPQYGPTATREQFVQPHGKKIILASNIPQWGSEARDVDPITHTNGSKIEIRLRHY